MLFSTSGVCKINFGLAQKKHSTQNSPRHPGWFINIHSKLTDTTRSRVVVVDDINLGGRCSVFGSEGKRMQTLGVGSPRVFFHRNLLCWSFQSRKIEKTRCRTPRPTVFSKGCFNSVMIPNFFTIGNGCFNWFFKKHPTWKTGWPWGSRYLRTAAEIWRSRKWNLATEHQTEGRHGRFHEKLFRSSRTMKSLQTMQSNTLIRRGFPTLPVDCTITTAWTKSECYEKDLLPSS